MATETHIVPKVDGEDHDGDHHFNIWTTPDAPGGSGEAQEGPR